MKRIKNNLRRICAAAVVGVSLFAGSLSALAAEPWQLPETGLQYDMAEKQVYIGKQMDAILYPKKDAAALMPTTFTPPDGWKYRTFTVQGVQTEVLTNNKGIAGRVVLQLHGGGYIGSLNNRFRDLAVKQAVLTRAAEVYMVNYRLAPAHVYPAALEDAVQVYKEIVQRGTKPRDIIVTGDSAGGNLALALSLYLKENHLAQPGLLLLQSPWATLDTDLPSRKANAERDLILGVHNPVMYQAVNIPAYGKGLSLKDPRLSPLYADLTGLPPMLIQVGGYEMFLDEGIALSKKAATDNVEVTLTVYPGMSHDFALIVPDLKESVDSFREIESFVGRHM